MTEHTRSPVNGATMRCGVLGREDCKRLAPWLKLSKARDIEVLFAVTSFGEAIETTIERYQFELATCEVAGPIIAHVGCYLHTPETPRGVLAPEDDRHLYWPPLDVVEAAVVEARRRGGR